MNYSVFSSVAAACTLAFLYSPTIQAGELKDTHKTALASNTSTEPVSLKQEIAHNSSVSFGGSYTYVKLKPKHEPDFHGSLGGMQGLYEYRPKEGFYGALKASWRQGETDRAGASRFLVDVTAEERVGFTVNCNDQKWLWTFFSGLGFRYLHHHLKENGEALRFIYNEFYTPVGLFSDYSFTSMLSWGIHITWKPQIFPTVTISSLEGARWKTRISAGNILVEAPLNLFLGKNKQFFINLVPFFEFWKDGSTTAKTSTGEKLGLPSNTYFFWGTELNGGYRF